ncbi:bifunctional hydroxymethylpyrimidine kinase/phosphomethylpyrimidine kinase [Alkaliphilus sp. MSJ-5]|uniref:Bifunctional hydroxymethylpyrimidine kinase/phosphomethylpyrimidine kinase n=1 Tax=Alkaliphilus flagellatus TaxID=2841507 RepID=A0ABS6FZ19_9FIRM|nr:PfkB family carbohydrate kinase [Alkaliphilus flagellatus]MBU5675131.1 bifunctional hydroxymethylpyrimidine kinase/phosphomethylpyrimidine kinase [Alkaliphilus flagellatus]
MTNREQEILELIKNNPMISQNDLANILAITRSSVAVHITNLIKKGYILGKGYIVHKDSYVSIVGGANMDIHGFPAGNLILKDSNIGNVKISLGGVGRNIGENLVKLGIDTRLISVIGDDIYGSKILEEARLIGLNMQDSLILKGEPTSTYLSILDESGDMAVAISQMDVYDRMTVEFIKDKRHVIENSRLCIIDTNIPSEVIEYILTTYKDIDFFLDTVSTTKARKVKNLIGYFHTIKPNKIEAEMLTGIEIINEDDLKRAAEHLIKKGVKRVFISLGDKGIFYSDGNHMKHIEVPRVKIVNATGAGDAFVAGLAYGYLNDMDIDESARIAITASTIAISHENTINPNMSIQNINLKMKEIGLC